MYIEKVLNRNSRPAILLREGWREGGKVRKRTLANLTDWPAHKVEALRRMLKDEPLVSPQAAFAIERSLPHGHVEAVLETIRKIGLDTVIATKRTRERDLVLAMIAERVIRPCSKLATTRLWHATTLAETLQVGDADEDELYGAMDWLVARQSRIERKLAARHFAEGSQVLYDVSSSYYEGRTCPLARFGHNRDGKRGKPIVVYGVLTDAEGRPLAVEVYPGNTGDPSTVMKTENCTKRFMMSLYPMGARKTRTEKFPRWETPWISKTQAIRTLLAIRNCRCFGPIRISIPRSWPFTTYGCWRFPRRAGRLTMAGFSASRKFRRRCL